MQHEPTAAGAATVTITAQIAIALASVPMAMMTLPLVVNVPEYFGNALGLNLALVGTIFMAVRIFDIVVDPVLGLAMDSTTTRWGRFRPWLIAGVPIFIAGTAMLFMARPGIGPGHLVAGLVLAYLGWSILSLAQLSLAAGLVRGYAARARIYAWIQTSFLGGICIVLLLPLHKDQAQTPAPCPTESPEPYGSSRPLHEGKSHPCGLQKV